MLDVTLNVYMDSLPDFVKLTGNYGHVGIKVIPSDQLEAAMQKKFPLIFQLAV